jgi:hypothetical protein
MSSGIGADYAALVVGGDIPIRYARNDPARSVFERGPTTPSVRIPYNIVVLLVGAATLGVAAFPGYGNARRQAAV